MAYDIYFKLTDPETQRNTGKLFTFGYTSSIGVRGPQKLVNRWVRCLLTPKGSDPFDPNYGTGCANMLGSNVTSTEEALSLFAIFVEECNEQIRVMDRKNFPPEDERFKTAEILKLVELEPDGFQVFVEIKNVAGQRVTLPLPVAGTAR